MKRFLTISLLAMFCLMVSGVEHAEAKRFGMGSSFGKSFNKRAAPAPRMSQQKQATPSKQGAASPARGGMMGMIGGLALGGMLGALFFGGAFEGINFFDILIFGAIAYMLFAWMRRKSQSAAKNYAYAGQQPEQHRDDAFTSAEHTPQVSGHALRPDIDEAHFIPAAKDIFMRMQTAWDNKDMNDIRSFCTSKVVDKIELDMQAMSDNSSRTEVTMLNADIADTWIESDDEWVAIHFSALIKEESFDTQGQSRETQAHEAKETWIFRHAPQSDNPTWYLAGIQQGH